LDQILDLEKELKLVIIKYWSENTSQSRREEVALSLGLRNDILSSKIDVFHSQLNEVAISGAQWSIGILSDVKGLSDLLVNDSVELVRVVEEVKLQIGWDGAGSIN
jgi:hypothetical protein